MEKNKTLNAFGRMLMPSGFKTTVRLIMKYLKVCSSREKLHAKRSNRQKGDC